MANSLWKKQGRKNQKTKRKQKDHEGGPLTGLNLRGGLGVKKKAKYRMERGEKTKKGEKG